jgi:predicted membrane-bound spermidine synthase
MTRAWPLYGIGLLSLSTIAVQLALTRIFSVTMYYHFAFMVISLALLGIAVAGVVVYLMPRVFNEERAPLWAAAFTVLFAISSAVAVQVTLSLPIRPSELIGSAGSLTKIYLASAVPFLMSAFGITLMLTHAGSAFGRAYAYDLIGAALGCVLVVPLLSFAGAPGTVLVLGGVGCVAATCFALASSARLRLPLAGLAGVLGLVFIGVGLEEPVEKRLGEARNPYKFIGDRKFLFEEWNAFSQITVGRGDDDHNWIFIDGDAATRMWSGKLKEDGYKATRRVPEVRVASLPYALRHDGTALIIGPGGGADVISALFYGAPRVVGVEINPLIADRVMRGAFAGYAGSIYSDPRVRIVVDEGRSFIRRSAEKYSTIQATLVDTWAASSSGAFTLSENNLYTKDAYLDFLNALEPTGILSMTRWYTADKPLEMQRLLLLARAALEELSPGIDVPGCFAIATDGQRRTTLLLGRAPFSDADLELLVTTARKERLRILYLPPEGRELPAAVAARGTIAIDPAIAKAIEAKTIAAFAATTDHDVRPPTDDRPFFFYTLFPHQLFGLLANADSVALDNLGALMLLLLLGLSFTLTVLLVIVPLFAFRASALRERSGEKLRVLAYFLCLGLGFILVEIGLMQRFVLFLGHPIYSLAVVLATLLAASGIGSSLSEHFEARLGARFISVVVGALAAVLLVYGFGLSPLFHALLGQPLGLRIALAALLVFQPGLLMGMLLPAGVRAARSISADLVPWGWGLNGATSVMGSILAMFAAMNYGFTAVLFAGLFVYAITPLLLPRPAS